MNENDQYQIPKHEIDNQFAEIAGENPELTEIGREITESYNNDRSAVGAAAIDTTRLEYGGTTPEQQVHPSIVAISDMGTHIHELRNDRLGNRSDYTLGA